MRKFLLPLLFLFLFIAESLFVQLLPAATFGDGRIVVPHFLFAAIIFLTIYVGKKQGIIYGAIFGLLFDVVYVEIIGIYLFIFPFISYLVSKIMHVMQNNIIIAYLVSLVGIALLEIGVYEMNVLIHVTTLDFVSYIQLRFVPTLLFNASFLLLAAYPFKRWFEKYAEAINQE